MRAFVLLAVVMAVAACEPATPTVRTFAPDTGRIAPVRDEDDLIGACIRQPPHDARWTPTEEEVATLDPVLIELIEYRLMEENTSYEDTSEMRPELYHRHYIGLEREGWRYILICGQYNATPIRYHDGGPSHFAAMYDTRRKLFEWFDFGHRA